MSDLVSVIIPTYNRFYYLLNTLKSIQQQTYTNFEIIVVNDCSTQSEYYSGNWVNKFRNTHLINLAENSKKKFGYACAAYVRNQGAKAAKGKYLAFCDDDDIWFPRKLELQLLAMKRTGLKMSCTDGLIGRGIYDSQKKYLVYNKEACYQQIRDIFTNKGSNLLDNGFPDSFTLELIQIHNCIITSSVTVEKELFQQVGGMKHIRPPGEDYDCWLRLLKLTDVVYIKEPCIYYDLGHGAGQNY